MDTSLFTLRRVCGYPPDRGNSKDWLGRLQVKTLVIEPGNPWENGYVESFNGKLRDELLNGERFTTMLEAQVLVAEWH